jgi:hypothetical protein
MSIRAWREGLVRVWRYRGLWAALFALNLVTGLALAALPGAGLLGLLGRRPAIWQAAREGFSLRLALDLLMAGLASAQAGLENSMPEAADALSLVILSTLAGALAAPLVAWLPATFLGGGLLSTYTAQPRPWCWRRFLRACWHTFGAFLLLGLVQLAGYALLVGPLALGGLAIAVAAGWPGWLVLALALLLGLAWQAVCELARAVAVVTGRRHAGRALGAALRLAWRHAPPLALFYGLAFGVLGLLHALYRWGLAPLLPLHAWLLVFALQQALVLLRLGLRLVRLAGGLALVERLAPPHTGAGPEAGGP